MSNIKINWIDESNEKALPIDCPICNYLIVTVEDVNCLKEFGCCEECHLIYYYPNK